MTGLWVHSQESSLTAAAARISFLSATNAGLRELLKLLRGGIVADQVFEDSEHVLAILYDAFENRPQLRLANRLAVPFREDRWRHLYIASQFFRRMSAQE